MKEITKLCMNRAVPSPLSRKQGGKRRSCFKLNGLISIAAAILLLAGSAFPAFASGVYDTYTYDYWGDPSRSPDGYEVERVVNGEEITSGRLNNPQDLYIDDTGSIYIADTDNGRVVICDNEFHLKKIITEVVVDGVKTALLKPNGLFVTKDQKLLIVDKELKMVFRCDMEGNVEQIYQKPEMDIEFTGIDYIPLKVVADQNGYVYVLCQDMHQGLLTYQENGAFTGYFGANPTKVTLETMATAVWKRFMTKEQRSKATQIVPVGISNVDIDNKNFIYTCTSATVGMDTGTEQIRKINPKSVNVLPTNTSIVTKYQNVFGDLVAKQANGKVNISTLSDVAYDEDGFINCLDDSGGKIFQYDNDCNLLFAFGNNGSQKGTFSQATAIDTFNGKIYVLDALKRNIVVLNKTLYGEYLHQAITYYTLGEYEKSEECWNEVFKLNNNLGIAYIGIGKIKYQQQDYAAAMEYFKAGEDRVNYGKAFKHCRNAVVRSLIIPVLIAIIVLAIAGYLYKLYRKKKGKKERKKHKIPRGIFEFKRWLKAIIHPVSVFSDMWEHKDYYFPMSFVSLLILFIAKVAERQTTGFSFNYNNLADFNAPFIFAGVFGIFLLWTIVNWAISTLFDGKAKIKQIWYFSSVALLPYSISLFISVILSNVLVPDEGIFLNWIVYIGIAWSVFLLCAALMIIHDYGFGKVIWSSLFSIVGIIVIAFIAVLIFSLFQQIYGFIQDIVSEIIYIILYEGN